MKEIFHNLISLQPKLQCKIDMIKTIHLKMRLRHISTEMENIYLVIKGANKKYYLGELTNHWREEMLNFPNVQYLNFHVL